MDNSIRQYIDIYNEHHQEIDSGSASVMNCLRPVAKLNLEKMSIPTKGAENYETTDLRELLGQEYGVNINRISLPVNPADSFKCAVPRIATLLYIMINDRLGVVGHPETTFPEGVEICSLREKSLENPEEVEALYGRLANPTNPIVALTTLLAQDGLWIKVKKGVKVEEPVQIVNILGGADNMLTPTRIVIDMEEGSEMKLLLCGHTSRGNKEEMLLRSDEIYVGAGAHLDIYEMEESDETTVRLTATYLKQEADSEVLVNSMTIYNGVTRNEIYCQYAAPGSSLRLYGLGIADGDRHIDTYTKVDHNFGNCHTDELFKYSADDRAVCAFTGMVRVDYGASKTEAYQSNRNLIGSEEARIYSKPQLEIYNDDVKCSHGSATGQLDEMQMFYMETRGLSSETARLLLKQAFMADVIESVRIPGLKERLTHIVERRFAGENAGCRDCEALGFRL